MAKRKGEKIEIACQGCGRTQTVRKSKLVPCDYYTCSFDCKANPDWAHPYRPEGFVRVAHMHAAGAFYGHEIRPATEDEKASIDRAEAIRSAGLRQLLERQFLE